MITPLVAESEEEPKSLFRRVKEGSKKSGLKLNIKKMMIMASGPITLWKINGLKVETAAYFILSGTKITADGDWSHRIKRCLLLGRKAMTNLDSILKSRHTANKGLYIQCYGFTSSHVQCESWTIKKTECQRIDYFTLWCWRRLSTVSWTARGSDQSILKEINPQYSLVGLMLKLKLQYFGHLTRRANPLEKTLMLGNIDGRKRKEWQRMRCLDGITDSMDVCLNKLQEIVKDRGVWCAAVHGVVSVR